MAQILTLGSSMDDGNPGALPGRVRRWFPSQTALAVLGMVAFVVAKALASGGGITIDQLEFWLIGLIPAVVFWQLDRRLDRPRLAAALPPAHRLASFLAFWLLLLVLFTAFRLQPWNTSIRDGATALLGGSFLATDLLEPVAIALAGAVIFAIPQRLRPKVVGLTGGDLACASALGAVLLFLLLFVLPPV